MAEQKTSDAGKLGWSAVDCVNRSMVSASSVDRELGSAGEES